MTVNDPTGSGAVIAASISGGAVIGLTVQNPGSGTVADARLSANVPLLNGSAAFAGTVTAASFNGPGALPWLVVSGTAAQAQPNTGYLLTNDALVTVRLPAVPNPGDVVRVSGIGAGGWKFTQNDSQSVLAKNLPGNFGGIWTPRESNRTWRAVASSSDGSKLVAAVEDGQIYTSSSRSASGTAGYLLGDQYSAVELQYIGNGVFMTISYAGTLLAY